MVKIHVLAFIYIIWTGQAHGEEKPDGLHLVCRHGDRNIFKGYKNDPFKDSRYWPGGFGNLTSIGRQQHFDLGEFLRKTYPHLVQQADKIYVESSNRLRTRQSGESNIRGIYPSNPGAIKVKVINEQEDHFLLMSEKCPRFDYLMSLYLNETDTKYADLMRKNKKMKKRVEQNSGEKQNTITDMWKLYDTLTVENMKGFNLADWAKKEIKENSEFTRNALFFYEVFTRKQEMKLLRSGYLLQRILERAEAKVKGQVNTNIWMSFAHDTTIASLLDSLDLFYPTHMPPYASCLIFEIFKGTNGNKPSMKLLYLRTLRDIRNQYFGKCADSKECTLQEWQQVFSNILPQKSYKNACKCPAAMLPTGKVVP